MIVVEKSLRRLTVQNTRREVIYTCPVFLGCEPLGAKRAEGDGRTPEGVYRLVTVNRASRFHAAFGISYPGRADARRAYEEQRIGLPTALLIAVCDRLRLRPPWNTPLGGFVMLHGESPEGKTGDWTAGCIAVSNDDIDRLLLMCKKGEKIIILP